MSLTKRRDDAREEVRDRGRAAADADGATFETREFAYGTQARVGAAEGFVGVLEEEAAGVGEFDAAARAVEQVSAGFALELLEHGREGRLGDAQGARGARHVPGAGDGLEVAERSEFHT